VSPPTQTLRLKNQGSSPAVCCLEPSLKELGLAVHPEAFRIEPGETAEVVVSITPPAPRNYQVRCELYMLVSVPVTSAYFTSRAPAAGPIGMPQPSEACLFLPSPWFVLTSSINVTQGIYATFNVRGGRNARVPLLAESVLPDIKLAQEAFDYGRVAIGADVSLPLTLSNRGTIAASLVLDLTSYTGFSIAYGADEMQVCSMTRGLGPLPYGEPGAPGAPGLGCGCIGMTRVPASALQVSNISTGDPAPDKLDGSFLVR
jgi:hypothetical protein